MYYQEGQIIVNVAKGIGSGTLMTMSKDIQPEMPNATMVSLSGPTHAEEVTNDLPTTTVVACERLDVAEYIQQMFSNHIMRVHTNRMLRALNCAEHEKKHNCSWNCLCINDYRKRSIKSN